MSKRAHLKLINQGYNKMYLCYLTVELVQTVQVQLYNPIAYATIGVVGTFGSPGVTGGFFSPSLCVGAITGATPSETDSAVLTGPAAFTSGAFGVSTSPSTFTSADFSALGIVNSAGFSALALTVSAGFTVATSTGFCSVDTGATGVAAAGADVCVTIGAVDTAGAT